MKVEIASRGWVRRERIGEDRIGKRWIGRRWIGRGWFRVGVFRTCRIDWTGTKRSTIQ